MANRNFANGGKIMTMNAGPVIVNTNITIGATGAVTSSTSTTMVTSVTRTSTGIYVLHLANAYFKAISISASMQSPSSGLSGILGIESGNAPNTSVASSTAPTITIKTLDAAGALANPASGSVISVTALLSNSSVQIP